jgi:hypothetical protein
VLLTVPDAGLEVLLASSVLLKQTWPGASQEAMMLIQVLRVAAPSLADVLAIGLVSLLTPSTGRSAAEVALVHQRAVLSAIARRESGARVTAPHTHPCDVTWLEVTDLAVAGRSCLGMTG